MITVEFEAEFPEVMERILETFSEWLHDNYPLKGDYSIKVFPAIGGFVDEAVSGVTAVVVTRWLGGKRIHWPTVEHALDCLAHEYKHLLQSDSEDCTMTERGVEKWAQARVEKAFELGLFQ